MYHDQVLTPIKTIYGFDAINITLGLPFIRISPDHGPNEKMLGKNISSPLSLIQTLILLTNLTIKYKKKLGQNFLVDKNIIKKIINFSLIKNHDFILEIGPGSGNLTNEILNKNPKKMKVIEKDENLIPILLKKFDKKIDILNYDILKIDEKKLFESKCKVFGNLPYNISTKIISKWILNEIVL